MFMRNSCDLRGGSCDKSCVMTEEMLHNILAANTIRTTRTREHIQICRERGLHGRGRRCEGGGEGGRETCGRRLWVREKIRIQ